MKIDKRIIYALAVMLIMSVPLVPAYVVGWRAEDSGLSLIIQARFSTHQWLAWEAVDMFADANVNWITDHLLRFWQGVEAPFNGEAATLVGLNENDYNNIESSSSVVYLDATGTIVTDDSLAVLAQREYDKLVAELAEEKTDYSLAAFYAGAMSHYISQAGIYKAIWDSSIWGSLNTTNWVKFETAIENGLTKALYNIPIFNFNYEDMTIYYNEFFSLSPNTVPEVDAYNATIDLAKNIHSLAQDIHDDFNYSINNADDWEASYYDKVELCLTYSVEAIYAAISKAMSVVNWRYISIIGNPVFEYYNTTNRIYIPEFEVKYTEDKTTYTLNESMTTAAEVFYIYHTAANVPSSLSTDKLDLQYNDTTEKWYLEETWALHTATTTNHSILYRFDMDRAAPTWSNLSTQFFYVNIYHANITSMNYYYNSALRTLSITNVIARCWDIPEIDFIEPNETISATWHLYQKGIGSTQTGQVIGMPIYNTNSNVSVDPPIRGTLTFNATNGTTWHSINNDIGLVFTPSNVELYIIIRFYLIIPVGHTRPAPTGSGTTFYPYLQRQTTNYFITRDHQVTVSKPRIEFNPETKILNFYDVTGYADYNNTPLNYYELVENKKIYGSDRREYSWKIFLYDGIVSDIYASLNWSSSGEYWYRENIDVSRLPDNKYYVAAKLVNMNMNSTVSPWGPPSDLFEIKRPIPIIYYILPEFFLIGFLFLFGYLAWYRPRMKKKRLEVERDEKLDLGFGD